MNIDSLLPQDNQFSSLRRVLTYSNDNESNTSRLLDIKRGKTAVSPLVKITLSIDQVVEPLCASAFLRAISI